MHTITVYLSKKEAVIPYLNGNMTGSRAVRNTANFLIRNVYTALGKTEEDRTPKENAVLLKVCMCLREANLRKEEQHRKKLEGGSEHRLHLFQIPDEEHRFLSYEQIDAVLKCSEDPAYYSCTSQVNQQAIRKTCQSWKAYFQSLKAWKKDPASFTGKPHIPGYIQTEKATAHFTSQVSQLIEDGKGFYLGFSNTKDRVFLGKMPVHGKYVKTEVSPRCEGCVLKITFDAGETMPEVPKEPKRIMAVDPGTNNFAACVTNTGMRPFLIDGRHLKSVNQFFNKELAEKRAHLMKGSNPEDRTIRRTSRRIEKLSEKRERIIRDYFYKAAHEICRRAAAEKVELILYGHNKGQKQEIGIGKVNNQNFVQIPFERFFHVLRWIASKYGIAVTMAEESYTSKADFLLDDVIPVYGKEKGEPTFSGKRIRRGLYRSGNGQIFNADVNGAANILRKHYASQAEQLSWKELSSVEKVGYGELYPAKVRYKAGKAA